MPRWQLVIRLLRRSRQYDTLVIDGAGRYHERIAAAAVRWWRPRVRIIITDATWSPGVRRVGRFLRRIAVWALDGPRTHYLVLSTDEQRSFPTTWRVDPERVHFTPFYWTLPEPDPKPLSGSGIFAGGNSLRDYETLLAAVTPLTSETITIATTWIPPSGAAPAHVHVAPVHHDRFLELLRTSDIVITPMPPGLIRSAGQQTYLNAMALGKITITSDVPGARDYIEEGVTGLIVPPGRPDVLRGAIEWALDPSNAAAASEMRARAAESVRCFNPDAYVEHILDVVDSLPARVGERP